MKHKTLQRKGDLCSNMSVALCCPLCDRHSYITSPIHLFSLFGIVRTVCENRASLHSFFFFVCLFLSLLQVKQQLYSVLEICRELKTNKTKKPHWPQWLIPCTRPADLMLFAYIAAAGGIRASFPSCVQAQKDAWRCSDSSHIPFFFPLCHLTSMITT